MTKTDYQTIAHAQEDLSMGNIDLPRRVIDALRIERDALRTALDEAERERQRLADDVSLLMQSSRSARSRLADAEAAAIAFQGRMQDIAAERDAAIARAEAAESVLREASENLRPQVVVNETGPDRVECRTCDSYTTINYRDGAAAFDNACNRLSHFAGTCVYYIGAVLAKEGGDHG